MIIYGDDDGVKVYLLSVKSKDVEYRLLLPFHEDYE
jgi:hypothetical protein